MAAPLTVPFTPTALADAVDISVPYASQIISGVKPLNLGMAIRIFDNLKVKVGPIADATDEHIAVLRSYGVAA